MVVAFPVDVLRLIGLGDFVVGLLLDVGAELLLVDDPVVVLAGAAVAGVLLLVLVGGQAAVEPAPLALHLVLGQLVPDCVEGTVLSASSFIPSPLMSGSTASCASCPEPNTMLQEESLIHSILKWGWMWK